MRFHPRGLGASGQGALFSASYDDTVKVWAEDGDDWSCAQTLVAHGSTVWSLAFGPPPPVSDEAPSAGGDHLSGEMLVSVSDDRSFILWTQKAGQGAGGWFPAQQVNRTFSCGGHGE